MHTRALCRAFKASHIALPVPLASLLHSGTLTTHPVLAPPKPGWATTFYNLRQLGVAPHSAVAPPSAASALPLPGCEAGDGLNFFGSSLVGTTCPGWNVTSLNESLPGDVYSELKYARVLAPEMPKDAHRAVPGAAYSACQTFMGQPDDPLECWDLVYDHCIPGFTNRNAIPKDILYHEQQVGELFVLLFVLLCLCHEGGVGGMPAQTHPAPLSSSRWGWRGWEC